MLRQVHLAGAISRAALANRLGLNRSTILALATQLTAAGLVREEASGTTGLVGRPSLVVRPESGRWYVLAFDVAVDRLVAARGGLGGLVLERREAPRRRRHADLDEVVGVLAGFGRELVDAAPRSARCLGVGTSYCGLVRAPTGWCSWLPTWAGPTWISGPRSAIGWGWGCPWLSATKPTWVRWPSLNAERASATRSGLPHGDVGVGGGIIVGGRLLGGDDGYGAELGHMIVDPFGGRSRNCGSHGCLEAEVGEVALLEASGRTGGPCRRDGVRAVVEAAGNGDEAARKALERVGDWLGIGMVNLVNLSNPGVVVFGSTLGDIYQGAAPQVRARVAASVLPVSRGVGLRTSMLRYDASLVGAAELAFSRVLADPLDALDSTAQ
ncbi:ROK family protein [Nonomuraea harbinensis]|uniref:ROK family protein n=1 Tax=Nonomuraea harbinensis TaxID=1286938 RepID=A0ABW1C8K8_9ACTN|nr:ROK family protein [Nonomuraea harbinensis]